ncbi:MAG: hydantoinase/oxoprolinase family protein [Acidimicrobiia bacterium]|nr:hydantoinase/oxoprolinase family protein [Acidimicrobiia bacterium]
MTGSDPSTSLSIAVDIGGTFTDLAVVGAAGIVAVGKVLTSSDNPARAVEEVIVGMLDETGLRPEAISYFVHGTTLVTNALIERKGSQTALLTTAGFRDALEMRREHRYELYDLMIDLPVPLVPRHLRFDVPERTLADGTVAIPIDLDHVRRLALELADHEIRSVAICFLHSFTNPDHERAARQAMLEEVPDLRISISSDVSPDIREFERTSTTVANVYVQDLAQSYLDDLAARTSSMGIKQSPLIMLSNGGVATIDLAGRHPIRMVESGPAGGALAAAAFGAQNDQGDLMAFDMGGTTAKLTVIDGGEPLVTHDFEVDRIYRLKPGSGLPLNVPVIDMIEIGVGGGSMARTNDLGLLTVGPDSAGSAPGPVCYGLGGTTPTVTDADLVLGYLNPAYFLGGRMRVDGEAARDAIRAHIATPLGIPVEAAAYGIHTTANDDMANAARVHAIERGKDATKLPLFLMGGAGPVHGMGVAAGLGSPSVVVPPTAGVLSAVGMLSAPLAFDFVRPVHAEIGSITSESVSDAFAEMEAEGDELLRESGAASVEHRRYVDMRYVGQGYEVRVPIDASHLDDWPDRLHGAFEKAYAALYGRPGPEVPIEALSWRVVSRGPKPRVTLRAPRPARNPEALRGSRPAFFGAGFVDTTVWNRYGLRPGDKVKGPAIVEEEESTLVMPPGSECVVADDTSLIVTWT